jgi:hypothetical protein
MDRGICLTVVLAIAVLVGCGTELGDGAPVSGGSGGAAGASPGAAGGSSITKAGDTSGKFLPPTTALQDFIHGG